MLIDVGAEGPLSGLSDYVICQGVHGGRYLNGSSGTQPSVSQHGAGPERVDFDPAGLTVW